MRLSSKIASTWARIAEAFVKRRSSVQARLAALVFPSDRRNWTSPESPPSDPQNGVFGTDSVHRRRLNFPVVGLSPRTVGGLP